MSPQQKTQSVTQETSSETPNEALETKYTESQWREMQSKIRKAEAERINRLNDRISELESAKSTLESQVESLTTNEDVLKQTVADLHSQIEVGVPDDAKAIFNENQKLKVSVREREAKIKRELEMSKSELARFKDVERKQLAENLSAKYGVDTDTLMTFKDVKDMKAYALDNMDVSKFKPAEQPDTEVSPADSPLLPKPSSPQIQPQGSGADRKFSQEEVNSMNLDTYTKNREIILRQFQEGTLK